MCVCLLIKTPYASKLNLLGDVRVSVDQDTVCLKLSLLGDVRVSVDQDTVCLETELTLDCLIMERLENQKPKVRKKNPY